MDPFEIAKEQEVEEYLDNWKYCMEKGFISGAAMYELKYYKAKMDLLLYALEDVEDQKVLHWGPEQSPLDCAIEYFRRMKAE